MDHPARQQRSVATRCARMTALSVTFLLVLFAALPSVGAAQQGTRMPLAAQPLLEVEIDVRDAGELEQLEAMGLSCPGAGSCRLELSDPQVTALKEAGLQFRVLQRLVKLTLQAPDVEPQGEQSISQWNNTDYAIPDYSFGAPGHVQSTVSISGAPSGVTVTKIQYELHVIHTYVGDLELLVSHDSPYKYITVWDRGGGPSDGGLDDDSEDDADVYLNRVDYTHFDGDEVNQTWYLEAWDYDFGDTGTIDYFQLRVYYCVPPAAPTPLTPGPQSHTCDTTPDFGWSAVSGATGYQIQVDNNVGFSSPEVDQTVSTPSFTPSTPLAPGAYHWRVRASDACGNGPWSGIIDLDIDAPPPAPALVTPPNASHTCDATPDFNWSAASGATGYQIQIDNNASFASPEYDRAMMTPGFTPGLPLSAGQQYWRVRASNNCGDGPWASGSFVVDTAPPAPTLTSPPDASHTCNRTFAFAWGIATAATSYRIQVDNDPAFGSPEVNATTATEEPAYLLTSPLAPGSYNWRVRGINACGNGPWSSVWSFVIDAAPSTPSGPSPANGATGVGLNADLDWADATGATSYDVYFGLSPTMPKLGNVLTSQYNLPTLLSDTIYYWKIVAKNACGETAGPMWSFTTGGGGTNHAPVNGTIAPNSGGAPAGQIVYFVSTWSDPDGEGDLKACRLHIGRWDAPKSLIGNAVLLYQARTNKLLIRNDRGTRWWGGKPVGSNNVIQNSQVKVYCNLTTVTPTGNQIQVRWAVEFKPAFQGRTKMYLKARDVAGLTSNLEKKGTWTVQ
jgi:hypothetical protein